MQQENLRSDVGLKGFFEFELVRNGQVIDRWKSENLVTDEGINHILNVAFNGATQVTQWYLSIFEGNYTPVAGLTAATYPAAATESSAYDEATRPQYVEATSTAKSITNTANKAAFTINATKTIYGAALLSVAAKDAVTGVCAAASKFDKERQLEDGDQLLAAYTINGSAV